MSEPSITDQVRALYEQYPFPAPLKSELPPALEGWCNYTFLYYTTMNEWRDCRDRWILDAGCGTGETLWPAAVNNPGAHLVGYDLSANSLEVARQKLARLGVNDVTFEQHDLNEMPPPSQTFDLIFCTGVLHHLADPLRGLHNVTRLLAPDGIMVLMLYAEAARADIKRVKEIFGLLGGEDPLPARLDMARQFFKSLPTAHVLRNSLHWHDEVFTARDEHLSDTFFHPREVNYTVESLFQFLDEAGLELIRFFNEEAFDLKFADADLQRRFSALGRRERYALADRFDPQGNYSFIVRHASHKPKSRPLASEIEAMIPMLSPVAIRSDRKPLVDVPLLSTQVKLDVCGFKLDQYRLDAEIQRVLDLCDGQRTVAQIATNCASKEAGVTLLLALETRNIVLFRRP